MTIDIISGVPVAVDETAALASPRHRFLRRAWFQAAVEAYGAGEATTIVGRRRDGSPFVALPITRVRCRLPLGCQVPGSYWPFRSVPVAQDASVEEMAAFLSDSRVRRTLGPVWRIGPVYTGDPAVSLLRQASPTAGWHWVERQVGTDFVLDLTDPALGGSWPRGSALKRNRYLERQLSRRGELRWRFVRGKEWSAAVLADLEMIEAASWVAHRTDRSDAKFLPEGHRSFWERLVQTTSPGDCVCAAVLYVADRPAAFSLDVESGDTKYIVANSYDPQFAECSPGRLLAYRNIQEALTRGIGRVDWGSGDSGYKQAVGARSAGPILDFLVIRGRRFGALAASLSADVWRRSSS